MWGMGAINESYSNCTSPILLVPKPDESVCVCMDFHNVNTFLKCDAYPNPCLDELLHQLGVAGLFCPFMNFTEGYWQTLLSSK